MAEVRKTETTNKHRKNEAICREKENPYLRIDPQHEAKTDIPAETFELQQRN